MARLEFPKDFVWGAATAAYQIEGATREDGRGESIWDKFCRIPGMIEEGVSGEPACRHYEYYKQDIALMRDIGLKSYRLSLAWPRIIPGGRGVENRKGLDFYERLIDELLKNKIHPNITLYHWDLPQVLEDQGGWASRDTAQAFADYAAVCLKRLGDRGCSWSTFNEPQCVANLGYGSGIHAPGRKEKPKVVNQVIHNILLAHGLAIRAMRAAASKPFQAGIVLVPETIYPASENMADIAAAEQRRMAINDWWFEPLLKGAYPKVVWDWQQQAGQAPDVQPGDMELIHQKIDWLGLNFYFPCRIKAGPTPLKSEIQWPKPGAGTPTTAMPAWEIYPPIAEKILSEVSQRYPDMPLYVTENGAAFDDPEPDKQGRVADPKRLDYIKQHLASAHAAIQKGIKLKGWYVWSFMDNFEWRFGYKKRFGLIYVDYASSKRFVKDSGKWYKRVIEEGGFEV